MTSVVLCSYVHGEGRNSVIRAAAHEASTDLWWNESDTGKNIEARQKRAGKSSKISNKLKPDGETRESGLK